jgi:hypothetical protein
MDNPEDFLKWFNNTPAFWGYGEYFEGDSPPEVPLTQVLNLQREKVKPFTIDVLEHLEKSDQGKELKLGIQAFSQFQDILGVSLHDDEDLWNRHYCYYESLVYLHEGVVAWLDQNVLAALALIRPFLELSVLHIYWFLRSERTGYKDLYLWMDDKKPKPAFRNQLDFILQSLQTTLPSGKRIRRVNEILVKSYKHLSAYHHSPKIDESVVSMSGGPGLISLETFFYYLASLNIVLRQVVFLYVLTYPTALSPVNRYKRWGFGGPMGLFFDANNFAILRAYLGEESTARMKGELADSEEVRANLDWFESEHDLTDEELEADWERLLENTKSSSVGKDIYHLGSRIAFHKAQSRAMGWAMNYINLRAKSEDIPDEVLPRIISIWKDW